MTDPGKLVYHDTGHKYWLNGHRAKSASKVAQIAADSFTIEQWQKRMQVIGMTLDPTLAERVAVNLDNREAIQAVCDDAHNAAKGNARANRGTQRHRVFELVLLGQKRALVTDQQRADAVVLERTIDAYGLTPMPDRVEQFVAWPDHGVVGRYDAVMGYKGRSTLVDLKLGINAVKYPHSTCVQFALYAFAPHTSARIERDGDRSTVTEWTTMPDDLDLETGYVLYCDDHHDVGELWSVDLVHGLAGAKLALAVVDWRKKLSYGKDVTAKVSGAGDAPDEPGTVGEAPSPALPAVSAETVQVAADDGPAATYRRIMLSDRYKALSDAQRRAYVKPADTSDLDAVEAAIDAVDPFATVLLPSQPAPPPAALPETALRFIGDEGPLLDAEVIETMAAQGKALSFEQAAPIHVIAKECTYGVGTISMRHTPTRRRWEIARALIIWARYGWDDELIRAAAAMVTNDPACQRPGIPLATIIGMLDAGQAEQFANIAANAERGSLTPIALVDGEWRWTLVPLDAA